MTRRRWIGRAAALLCQKTGETDPTLAIKRVAEALLDEVSFDEPPFTPEVLASYQGVLEVRRLPMSGAALELMRRLMEAEPTTLARLRPTEKQRSELAGLLVPYVRQRCEAALRSLGFIEELRVAPPESTHDQ